jgi:hypothetical protein
MRTRINSLSAVVGVCVGSLVKVVAPLHAFQYCRAAQRDERNRFPMTAAMEWHKAAELFAPVAPELADRCWQEWERIVGMPRRLAGALGVALVVPISLKAESTNCRRMAA